MGLQGEGGIPSDSYSPEECTVDATAPQHPQARMGIVSIRAEPVKTIVEQRLSLKSEYNPRGGHGSSRSRQIRQSISTDRVVVAALAEGDFFSWLGHAPL